MAWSGVWKARQARAGACLEAGQEGGRVQRVRNHFARCAIKSWATKDEGKGNKLTTMQSLGHTTQLCGGGAKALSV